MLETPKAFRYYIILNNSISKNFKGCYNGQSAGNQNLLMASIKVGTSETTREAPLTRG